MAVTANSIITPQAPKSNTVALSSANSNYTAPTNTAALITAGSNGARVTRIGAIPTATVTTAAQIQLFRSSDGGTTKRFFDSAAMATYTMAQTTEAPTTDFGYTDLNPLILQANEIVYMATGQAQAIAGNAEWFDY